MSAGFTTTGRVHRLKVAPQFFDEVEAGRKRAEFRFNDRDYQTGDLILLVEWHADIDHGQAGRTLTVGITHVLDKAAFEPMPENWVVLSIQRVESPDLDWQPDKEPELNNVVFLPIHTIDGRVEPQRVLSAALKAGLDEVVVVGWERPGRQGLYAAASCNVAEMFLLVDAAKHERLVARDQDEQGI